MSADGYVQVPPNSTGAKIDGASVDVAGNTVIRQRIVIADNSSSAQYAVVTGGALLVQPNAVAISGTPSVVLAGGSANIGAISSTVNVAVGAVSLGAGTALIGAVSLGPGSANIGFINGISATINTVAVIGGFIDSSGNTRNLVDSANLALRVNVVQGSGSGANPVSIAAGTSNIGFINNISATVTIAGTVNLSGTGSMVIAGFRDLTGATVTVVDAVTAAIRIIPAGTNGSVAISGFNDASGQHRILVDSANLSLRVSMVNATATASVVIGAGSSNIGTINNISQTVQVQIQTPFTVNNISRTVLCQVTSSFTIDAISATVTVTTANPYILNQASNSHGPIAVIRSTSATATLIAAPGAALHVYVTSLAVANAGSTLVNVQVGWSGSPLVVQMVAGATGGGFVWNFDPPWKVQSNEAVTCRVDPAPGGNCYINANFFVAA